MTIDTIASLGVALGTLALAFVAWKQVNASREQVDHAAEALKATERATAATERAAEATEAAAKETARARVDAMSLRVVAEMVAPEWPPMIHPGLRAMPGGGEPTLFDEPNVSASRQVQPSDTFAFPRQGDELLWFKVFGVLRNEGRGSALVHLPNTCRIADGDTPLGDPDGRVVRPRWTGEYMPRLVLEAGRCLIFEWWEGRPLKDWADAYENPNPPNPHGSCQLEVIATDTFADGVVDNLFIELAGRPLVPVPGEDGRWRILDSSPMVAATQPTVRRRRGLDPWEIESPWTRMYGEPR